MLVIGAVTLGLVGAMALVRRGSTDEPEQAAESLSEPRAQAQALVTYEGGEITSDDFLVHYFELPVEMRKSDNARNRKSQLMTLLDRRLLALEASQEPLTKEEKALPRVLRERIQIARLIDKAVAAERPGISGAVLSRARQVKASALAREARKKFRPSTDETALQELDLSKQPTWVSRDVEEILALPPSSRAPFTGPFRFAPDQYLECDGEIDPQGASISGRCDCESFSELMVWDYQLYFELYLSGRGLNAMNAYNMSTAPCVIQYITAGSTYTADVMDARLPTIQRGIDRVELKNADARQQKAFAAMLTSAGERIAQCAYYTGSRPGSAEYTARWTQLSDGRTIGMKVSSEGPATKCVQSHLEAWRFPELVEERTELEARFSLSVLFERPTLEEEDAIIRRAMRVETKQDAPPLQKGVSVEELQRRFRESRAQLSGKVMTVKGVLSIVETSDPRTSFIVVQQDSSRGPTVVCHLSGPAPTLQRFDPISVRGTVEGWGDAALQKCKVVE